MRQLIRGWGSIPNMREWIGSREIQNLIAHDYVVKNRTFELTTKIPVNDIADEQYGVYAPLVSEMGLSAKKHPDSLTFDLLRDGFKGNAMMVSAFSVTATRWADRIKPYSQTWAIKS